MQPVIKISATQEPSLVQVIISVVTKLGQYLDRGNARFLVGRGDISVNGEVVKNVGLTLEPGYYNLQIRGTTHYVLVSPVDKE